MPPSPGRGARLSRLSGFAVRLIRTYQRAVAPHLGARCCFDVSCSHYGLEMYRRHPFAKATAKTARRILSCNPWTAARRGRLTAEEAGRLRRMAAATLLAALALFALLTVPAGAEVTGDCSATFAGVDVADRSSTDPADAIPVQQGSSVPAAGQSPAPVNRVRVQLEFAGFRWTVADSAVSGTTWQETVDVDRYARYGVGLYKVLAVSEGAGTCTAAALVRVEGDPLRTAAGLGGAGLAAAGLAGLLVAGARAAGEGRGATPPAPGGGGAVWGAGINDGFRLCVGCLLPALLLTALVLVSGVPAAAGGGGGPARRVRWRPRISFVGLVAGLLTGVGSLILLQQYAVAYPTRTLTILVVGAGLALGVAIPSLFRLVAVRRLRRLAGG